MRRVCLLVLSQSSAPGPTTLVKALKRKKSKRNKQKQKSNAREMLDAQLQEAISKHELPSEAADRLRTLITNGCMPLPSNFEEALDKLQGSVNLLRSSDKEVKVDPRRMKRYEDISRNLNGLKHLVLSLDSLGVSPLFGSGKHSSTSRVNRPLYISLDLGLRQRRKHYHGQTLFQCIAIPDNYFEDNNDEETNEYVISSLGRGIKVCEGGRFDDLVSDVQLMSSIS